MLGFFLRPSWGLVAAAAVVLPLVSGTVAGWKAYGWGEAQCEVRWLKAKAEAEKAARDELNEIKKKLNVVTESHRAASEADAAEIDELQNKVHGYEASLTAENDGCDLTDDDLKWLSPIK